MEIVPVASKYDRLMVVSNPTKAETPAYEAVMLQITQLQEVHDWPVEYLATQKDGATTQKDVQAATEDGDLVIVIGGDGTVKDVVGGLVHLERQRKYDATDTYEAGRDGKPVLIAALGGTACDFMHNLHGKLTGPSALQHLVVTGQAVDIHALSLSYQAPVHDADIFEHTVSEELAAVQFGLNWTAKYSELLNGDRHRKGWLRRIPRVGLNLQEGVTSWVSLQDRASFDIIENGESQTLLNMSFIHGTIAAKYSRFAITHFDEEFLDFRQIKTSRTAIGASYIRSLRGNAGGSRIPSIEFTLGDHDVKAHADGEVFNIPAGSRVQVGLTEETFRTLHTKAA